MTGKRKIRSGSFKAKVAIAGGVTVGTQTVGTQHGGRSAYFDRCADFVSLTQTAVLTVAPVNS